MSLQELDEFLLKAVNNNYQNPVLDQIMICLSDHVFLAVPVIVALFYFCVKKIGLNDKTQDEIGSF